VTPVSAVMTPRLLTISSDAPLPDAAWGLSLQGIAGAPVTDEHGKLVGVLSRSDLADPRALRGDADAPHTVRDAMTPVLLAVRDSDPVSFAVRRLVETGVHRLIVVDAEGAPVGILTPMDVLRATHHGRLSPDELVSKPRDAAEE